MKICIRTPFEAQDGASTGGVRRFVAGEVCDLPEPWALSLIYSGAAEQVGDLVADADLPEDEPEAAEQVGDQVADADMPEDEPVEDLPPPPAKLKKRKKG